MFSCSRHLGLPETHQEHNETSADASTEPSAIHPQETSTEKRTQPRLRPDASTPVAAPPQLSERMIGQRQQDCTAGAPTVQGRERAPDARTQPMREHHGGLRTHNTEQWGGGEGEAGPPYLSMGGWNSPVSQVIWGRPRRGYLGERYPQRRSPRPPIPTDSQGRTSRPLAYCTRVGYPSTYQGHQSSSGFVYRDAPEYYDEEYYDYGEYDSYHLSQ